MLTMLSMVKTFVESKLGKRGAAMTEYAIILGFVAIVALFIFSDNGSFSTALKNLFQSVNTALEKFKPSV